MIRSVPGSIVGEIKRYDPALRVRWSNQKRKYVLERKAPRHLLPKPVRYSVIGEIPLSFDSDRMIQWKDGYAEILACPVADRRLIWALWSSDTNRLRRREDFLRKQAEREDLKERLEAKRQKEDLTSMAGESYGYLNRHLDGAI